MINYFRILIVGAGQLGSRHLQGALKSNNHLSITVVDPSLDSLNLSKRRAEEVKFGCYSSNIIFKQSLPKNENFHICIISTNSDVRAKVTQEVLFNCNVNQIIFEKVLFQNELDFKIISDLLKKKNISGWVNCGRRTYDYYQQIKRNLNTDLVISMSVKGKSWGMACNIIHYIDLFAYLVNDSNITITKTNLSNNIYASKRGNSFYEIYGMIECRIKNHLLTVSCAEDNSTSLSVKIINQNVEYYFDEVNGSSKSKVNGVITVKNQKIPYQSCLTDKIIDCLIKNNECELIPFEDSCKLHLTLLHEIKRHLSKVLNKKLDYCPIT